MYFNSEKKKKKDSLEASNTVNELTRYNFMLTKKKKNHHWKEKIQINRAKKLKGWGFTYIAHAHLNGSEDPEIIFGKVSQNVNIQLHRYLLLLLMVADSFIQNPPKIL